MFFSTLYMKRTNLLAQYRAKRLRKIALLAVSKRLEAVEAYKKNPLEIQRRVFNSLILRAKNTEWGKKYNYNEIKSFKNFIDTVPVNNYESLEPYIKRLISGETNLLWPGKTKNFAKSSGTTSSKSKFIPVTKEALKECHFQAGKDMLAMYFKQRPNSKFFIGSSFSLGGSRQNQELGKDKFIGDVSALIMNKLPVWAQARRVPRLKVACMSEWEEKLQKISEIIIKKNIISLSGVPSWMLVLSRKILDMTGTDNLLEVWPNLELFIHGGVNFSPYKEQFKKIIPTDIVDYLEAYNASEGFFAFQDDLNRNDMLLSLDSGVFYEFMSLEELDKDKPQTLMIDQVELDVNYALIISTNAGLWRYAVGDTIKFTSLYPHRIVVSGRVKSFINAFGEELIVENADKAMEETCKQLNTVIKDYTAAPVYMTNNTQGAHQWIIEFEKAPQDVENFAEVLDSELKKVNSDYEAKRYKDKVLTRLKLVVARDNLFYDWLEKQNRLGGQCKVPRLSNNRKIVDELLQIN